jgi:prevent-host-death family protein
MTDRASITEAKAGFARLVARAEAGDRIIVTRNGRPVACLGPLPKPPPIEYGDIEGVYVADDLSLPEEIIDDFYRSR